MPSSTAAHDAGTLLRERLKAKRGPVVCDCGIAAELSPESDVWQCRKRNCRFIYSVAETTEAPENHETPKRDVADCKTPEKKPVGHPPWLVDACQKCGYNIETMKPGEIEGFQLFIQ